MRLRDVVTVDDVGEAVRLMKVAMQQSSIDPRTGQIDMVRCAPAGRAAAGPGRWADNVDAPAATSPFLALIDLSPFCPPPSTCVTCRRT